MIAVDNIDVTMCDVKDLGKAYHAWYRNIANRNLAYVRNKTVAKQFNYKEELGVWHIPTILHTYPKAAELLKNRGLTSFDVGVDVGCGTVTFFDFVSVKCAFVLDIVFEYCCFMKAKNKIALNSNAENLPFPTDFADVVVCSDILEHVLSFDTALSEVFRILKPGGILVVDVPWNQMLSGTLADFSHLRTFNQDNLKPRFNKFVILDQAVIPSQYGWIGHIVIIMQKPY